jgi:hypothetical protein
MDEGTIRKQVRERLKTGKLPRHGPVAAPLKPGEPRPPSIVAGTPAVRSTDVLGDNVVRRVESWLKLTFHLSL